MRGFGPIGLGILVLAGCSDKNEPQPRPAASMPAAGRTIDSIPCAVGNRKPQDCPRELAASPDGPIWIVRRADGSFRRFVVGAGGIVTADSADEVRTQRHPDFVEVFVGDEYYRFPDDHAARP